MILSMLSIDSLALCSSAYRRRGNSEEIGEAATTREENESSEIALEEVISMFCACAYLVCVCL